MFRSRDHSRPISSVHLEVQAVWLEPPRGSPRNFVGKSLLEDTRDSNVEDPNNDTEWQLDYIVQYKCTVPVISVEYRCTKAVISVEYM